MRVFLIHGMGRTPVSMWILERRLRSAGHRPSLFGYFVTVSDLDDIADRFLRHVERVRAADARRNGGEGDSGGGRDEGAVDESSVDEGYAVVSHSLGGIITRMASPRLPPGLRCFVMLAPPNRPPSVVRKLSDNTVFRLFTRDAGQKLQDPDFYAGLPVPDVPILVVAGTRGPRAEWLPFEGEPNDSLLRVDETRLDGAPTLTVHGVHTFLMNRRDVFDAVRQFLEVHYPDRTGVC